MGLKKLMERLKNLSEINEEDSVEVDYYTYTVVVPKKVFQEVLKN